MEHPDISHALRTGYPPYTAAENRDTPESRMEYIKDHAMELVKWLELGMPDVLAEFIEFSWAACDVSYQAWLN